ncbi:unnamed protein product [Moneuplotes crassus]|uniref:Palmitoyltransferase n=1 Tax=Euplotes crassus TaxID=5936 RepID=A0AAD1X4Q0_EUPCR|nr:unnamed protein product [Moneuplotes crassus]
MNLASQLEQQPKMESISWQAYYQKKCFYILGSYAIVILMTTSFAQDTFLFSDKSMDVKAEFHQFNWIVFFLMLHNLYQFIQLLKTDPGIVYLKKESFVSRLLKVDINEGTKLAACINHKYKQLIELRKEQERCRDEDRPLLNFADQSDALAYKYGVLSQIQNDSANAFSYCDQCEIYKLPRMEHCRETNCCILRYSKTDMVPIGLCNYSLYIQWMLFTCLYSLIMNILLLPLILSLGKLKISGQLLLCLFFFYNLYTLFNKFPVISYECALIRSNQTQMDMIKGSFLNERACYLFQDQKYAKKPNIYANRESLMTNINMMLGNNCSSFSWVKHLFAPVPSYYRNFLNPLKETSYLKLSPEGVKELIDLKKKVEEKLNEKFIQKGFKVKQFVYLSHSSHKFVWVWHHSIHICSCEIKSRVLFLESLQKNVLFHCCFGHRV